jgi:hypothetical protein
MDTQSEAERLRARLRRVADELRAAEAAAMARDAWLASMLDDCRVDAERLLACDDGCLQQAEALFVRTELALRTFAKLAARPPAATPELKPCPFCRDGTLAPVACAGRSAPFRGVFLAIPADFPIPTCDRCQAEALDDETANRLDDVLMSAWAWRSSGRTALD